MDKRKLLLTWLLETYLPWIVQKHNFDVLDNTGKANLNFWHPYITEADVTAANIEMRYIWKYDPIHNPPYRLDFNRYYLLKKTGLLI